MPRLADSVTKQADFRNRSKLSKLVRYAGRFPDRPIPLFWFSGLPNFGDALSRVIVKHVSNGSPILVSGKFRGKVLAAGSVMGRLAEGDVVWGTGAIRDRPIEPPARVRFLAVRGPLTRELIRSDVPEIYGDPAFILPRIYRPASEKRFELGVIPHYIDMEDLRFRDPSILLIDVRSHWSSVVDAITSCRMILSSSLHGIIAAEAYGIPALWITVTDRVIGEGFKFRDYYLSTGREPPEPLPWKDALDRGDRHFSDPPVLDPEPLLRAWPADLQFPDGVGQDLTP